MEKVRKYLLAAVWVILPMLVGALLGHYLNLTWILLISFLISVLLLAVYWFFFQGFSTINKNIGLLKNRIEGINDAMGEALGTSGGGERLSWLLFWSKVQQLAAQIDGSDFDPDIVVSIGRSGAVVGGMLASLMGAKKHVAIDRLVVINKKPGFPEERNIEIDNSVIPNRDYLTGKKILGVMSECTSGNTLREINLFFTEIPGVQFKSAVIFCKPDICTCPHFYVERTEQWPELPFRVEGKWKNYYPRIEKDLPAENNKAKK